MMDDKVEPQLYISLGFCFNLYFYIILNESHEVNIYLLFNLNNKRCFVKKKTILNAKNIEIL